MNKSIVFGIGLTIIAIAVGVAGTYTLRSTTPDANVSVAEPQQTSSDPASHQNVDLVSSDASTQSEQASERAALDAMIAEVIELSNSQANSQVGKAIGRLNVLFTAANEQPGEFADHAEYVATNVASKTDGRTSEFAQEYLILASLRDGADDKQLFVAMAKFARKYPNGPAASKLYQRVANDLVNEGDGQRALRLLAHGVKHSGSKQISAALVKHHTMTRQTISLLGRVNSGSRRTKSKTRNTSSVAKQLGGDARYKKYVGKSPNIMGKTLQGRSVNRRDLQGEWTYVHFWATWCGACRSSVPSLVATQRKYAKQGVKFIGVNMDSDHDAAKKFMKSKGITWPQIAQSKGGWDSPLAKSLGVSSIPLSVFISPSGKIIAADATGRLGKQIDAQMQFSKGLKQGLEKGLKKGLEKYQSKQ